MSLLDLDIRSNIPGAVSRYGKPRKQVVKKVVVYNGTPLTRFVYANGGDPDDLRGFLYANKIGSPFTLEAGRTVVILTPASDAFPKHPEAK